MYCILHVDAYWQHLNVLKLKFKRRNTCYPLPEEQQYIAPSLDSLMRVLYLFVYRIGFKCSLENTFTNGPGMYIFTLTIHINSSCRTNVKNVLLHETLI